MHNNHKYEFDSIIHHWVHIQEACINSRHLKMWNVIE